MKSKVVDPPAPLLKDVRHLILRKCDRGKTKQMHAIFQKQPFGELERLVTQKLLDVVKRVAKEELQSEANGSDESLDSAAEAMKKCASASSSFWIRTSSTCRSRIVCRFWTR